MSASTSVSSGQPLAGLVSLLAEHQGHQPASGWLMARLPPEPQATVGQQCNGALNLKRPCLEDELLPGAIGRSNALRAALLGRAPQSEAGTPWQNGELAGVPQRQAGSWSVGLTFPPQRRDPKRRGTNSLRPGAALAPPAPGWRSRANSRSGANPDHRSLAFPAARFLGDWRQSLNMLRLAELQLNSGARNCSSLDRCGRASTSE